MVATSAWFIAWFLQAGFKVDVLVLVVAVAIGSAVHHLPLRFLDHDAWL